MVFKLDQESVLQLELPWPPSVNHYWVTRVIKHRVAKFVGQKGKEFREAVKQAVEPHLSHCEEHFKGEARLAVVVTIISPDKRKRDVDNLCKALLDAMEHAGAYDDDSQIDSLVLMRDRKHIESGGRVIVGIARIK